MELIYLSAVLILLVGAVFVWMNRANRSAFMGGFRTLQEQVETMQRNISLMNQDFERSQENKDSNLRKEISEAMQVNRRELQEGLRSTSETLQNRVEAIDTRLDTRLKELTHGVQSKLEANIQEGFVHFTKVQEHLKKTENQLKDLSMVGESINDLNNLLKLPHLRGGFGEASLERILADMMPSGAYELQYRIIPSSTERVDAVIHYPNQVLPIDSKFPREQVLPLFETNDPSVLESARKSLSEAIKTSAKQIKDKYIHPEHNTTEMALLYVPSETLFFEILRNLKLCEDLRKLKVFAVSPNTLAVTLHAISASRNYYEMAKGVEKTLKDMKLARSHFESFEKRYNDVGNALNKAQTAYHTAATHLSRYSGAVARLAGPEEAPPEVKQRVSPSQETLIPGSI